MRKTKKPDYIKRPGNQEKIKEYNQRYYLDKIKPNRITSRSNRKGKDFKTVSLLIAEPIYIELEKAVNNSNHKNMSKFIEDNLFDEKLNSLYRREYSGYLKKKTLTFSETFYKKIKASGNMSLCVEGFLKEKFNIK